MASETLCRTLSISPAQIFGLTLLGMKSFLTLRIIDDGPGFSPNVIYRIGDPFVRRRKRDGRKGYEGMGLGLFIAKTLLERSGAEMTFANGSEAGGSTGERTGAVVEVVWKREIFADADDAERSALGDNRPIKHRPTSY